MLLGVARGREGALSVLYSGLNNDQIYNSHKKETNPFGPVQQKAPVSETRTTKNAQFL